MELTFKTYGNDKQLEAVKHWLDDTITDVGYGGGKYGGKSYLGCSLIFGDALTYPGTHYAIARVELTDLVKFTYPSILEVFEAWGVTTRYWKFNGQYNYFELYNGSRVYFVPVKYLPSDPDFQRFGSMQFTRVWGEEIGEWHVKAKANLHITAGRWRNREYGLTGKGLYTFNPARNFTYDQYYKTWRDGTMPPYRRFVQALPTDNKKANPAVLDNMRNSLTNADYRRLFLGEWETGADPNCLVDYDAVCDVFANDHVLPDTSLSRKALSTDLATTGRDKWVAFDWSGDVAKLAINQPTATGKQIYQGTAEYAARNGVPRSRIVTDADGLGNYLESFLNGIYEFHANARPVEAATPGTPATARDTALYANLKTQCAYELARMIRERQIRIIVPGDDTGVIEQIKDELMLLIVEDVTSDATRRRLIPKDRMKALIGRSPDFLDALIMGMVFRVKQQYNGIRRFARVQ
jgi:hypothetical protein